MRDHPQHPGSTPAAALRAPGLAFCPRRSVLVQHLPTLGSSAKRCDTPDTHSATELNHSSEMKTFRPSEQYGSHAFERGVPPT
jgi:hypothetical protein